MNTVFSVLRWAGLPILLSRWQDASLRRARAHRELHRACAFLLTLTPATPQVKAWIALVPLSGAALVAISRTMDYRHHWQDVLTGSLLGLVTAYFSYRQYYPPLNSPISHLPYPPRYRRGGQEHPAAHRSSPAEAQALTNDQFENIAMRPRMPEQRYADRPSIGDEEMGHPPMVPSGSGLSKDIDASTSKDGWHQS